MGGAKRYPSIPLAKMMGFAKGLNPSYRVLCRRLQHCSAMEYDCKGFDRELPA